MVAWSETWYKYGIFSHAFSRLLHHIFAQMQANPGMIVQQSYQHPIQPGDPRFIGQQYTHYQQPMQQQQYVVQHGGQQQYIVQTNPTQQVQQGIPMQTYTHHQYTPGTQYTVQPQLQLQVHQGISPGMVQHAQPHIQAVYQGVPVQHVYPGQTGIPQVVQVVLLILYWGIY